MESSTRCAIARTGSSLSNSCGFVAVVFYLGSLGLFEKPVLNSSAPDLE